LLELGHPTHAFDADLLAGSTIRIAQAKQPMTVKTLDDIDRPIDPETLLIWDGERPVAIAGVMGAGNSEIHPKTKRIFIESAYFEARSIRMTSKRIGLSTESSYRFERSTDPEAPLLAICRIMDLLQEFGQAKVYSYN